MNEETRQTCNVDPIRLAKLVVIAIVCFGVGFFVGTRTEGVVSEGDAVGGDFAAGYEAARVKLIEEGYISAPTAMLSGSVKSVSNGALVLSRDSLDMLDDPRDVTIHVQADTEVVRVTPKDTDTWQQESDAYESALSAVTYDENGTPQSDLPQMPAAETRTPITLADIPQGSTVTIQTTEPVSYTSDSLVARVVELRMPMPTPDIVPMYTEEEVQTDADGTTEAGEAPAGSAESE